MVNAVGGQDLSRSRSAGGGPSQLHEGLDKSVISLVPPQEWAGKKVAFHEV